MDQENISKTYKDAVRTMKKLLKEEGRLNVIHAYSDAVSESVEIDRVKMFGIPTANKAMVAHLVGEKPEIDHYYNSFMDHTRERQREGEELPSVVESNPYTLGLEDLKEIIGACEKYGLRVIVSASESWHFPGRTVLVEFKRDKAD
jgi:hypothetical protein